MEEFGLTLKQNDFDMFCDSDSAKSLILKTEKLGRGINVFVNENIIVHKTRKAYSYEAALIASFIREKRSETNQCFSFETVMSHRSKLDEIKITKERGYRTYPYFVCLENPDINISRVQDRVAKGGHGVDSEKITSRYYRTLDNLIPAVKLSSRAYLFDNSVDAK
ncbi:MAG: hypothetical protein LBU65_06025 [Planctomycetaceae bacterium]|nr:hypothetical protein [Planctomycetaceae bacterium]